jgi:hypothetical protein
MGEFLDKVKDKMKDAKDTVVDGSLPSSDNTRIETKYTPDGPDVEIINTEPHASGGYGRYGVSTNAGRGEKPGSVIPDANTDTDTDIDTDSAVAINTNQGFTQRYRTENNGSSNPFVMGLKLWQNYAVLWMEFYTRVLDNYVRNASDFLKTSRETTITCHTVMNQGNTG